MSWQRSLRTLLVSRAMVQAGRVDCGYDLIALGKLLLPFLCGDVKFAEATSQCVPCNNMRHAYASIIKRLTSASGSRGSSRLSTSAKPASMSTVRKAAPSRVNGLQLQPMLD
jgi:hypothetical protein